MATAEDVDPVELAAEAAPGPKVRRALLSVSDKTGIIEFARGLADLGVEIISTGGTAGQLSSAGVPVRSITELTGFPEIMDGRVKTLHPKLYAGLLAVRDNPEHLEAAREHSVEFVDLVCVNLYPFERTVAQPGVADGDVIENIDIGGPTMIRAAAKNFVYAAPVVSPESYDAVLNELRETGGHLSRSTRSPTPRAMTPRSPAGSRRSMRTSRRCSCARSSRYWSSPTARTPTSAPPTTSRSARRRTCSPRSRSWAASRSRSTTCSISTPVSSCWPSSTSPPA
jgi:hypothetical protein